MAATPITALDRRFSSPDATPRPWEEVEAALAGAMLYWITTVRPDGRPHATPLGGVWRDGALHFCTGEREQKARNLAANPACLLTTGRNDWDRGLDVVVEGAAVPVTDEARLRALSDEWVAKYGEDWRFDVKDGVFHSDEGGRAPVFAVAPAKVLAFGKGEPYSQTAYSF
jgi:hypothetical protein